MSFSVEIIADSKSEIGNHRLTTVKATFPRYLLAEFNTHKMISKNSASSRAIPAKKLIQSVKDNPYVPERWMLDHKGMQGNTFITSEDIKLFKKACWLKARDNAINSSEEINANLSRVLGMQGFEEIPDSNVSKQISNRLLEPFMYHTALMSATEWENFFALRAESGAEINFQKTAFMLLDAMNASEPKQLKTGEWHLPYGDKIDENLLEPYEDFDQQRVKISAARCAGVSYVVIGADGKEESYEKLINRHSKLAEYGHFSPMEHPARAMNQFEYFNNTKTFILSEEAFDRYDAITDSATYNWESIINPHTNKRENLITEYGWCGNYRGFIMYRKMFPNENRRDSRLIKK